MSTGEFKSCQASVAQHPPALGAAGALCWVRAGLRLLERAADLVLSGRSARSSAVSSRR